MRHPLKSAVTAALSLLALACTALPAAAKYPERPVTIVVSVAPGAGPDVIARVLADRLTHLWKQQVIVLNRPGGGGILAAQAAAAANPDGYTLYMPVSSAFTVAPEGKTKWPVDLATDFAMLGLIGDQPMAIAVVPSLGVKSMSEFIALAKQRPGEILYGATRLSIPHMTGELLQMRAGIKLGYVPTVGAAKVIQDIMSGNLAAVVDSIPGMAGALQSGAVKALAVASDRRLDSHPDVPLLSDTLANADAKGWFVLMAPAKVPEAVLMQLRADLQTVLHDAELKRKFEAIGTFPRPLSLAQTLDYIKAEQDLWRPVVRQIGVE
jgi:tripartite-type tricarboxylate transporter receptor subunit TctC